MKSLDLSNNSIEQITENAFNNSYIQYLELSISNLSIENVWNLKNSFKQKILKEFANLAYFESIYIENRVDSFNCEKTLLFLKSKKFYNFRFEYDMIDFINNCNDFKKSSVSRH